MNTEQQKIEYKSLQKIRTGEKGFKELSTTCVALANAQGGQIMIGVEDKTKKPAPNQVISQEEANCAVTRLRGLCFNVGLAVGETHQQHGRKIDDDGDDDTDLTHTRSPFGAFSSMIKA